MAEIRPFIGVRYDQEVVGDLSAVVAAPYDIIGPDAQEAYYARSAYNVVRLELGRGHEGDTADDNRYSRAAATYRNWLRDGAVRPDAAAGFYLYEERFGDDGRPRMRRSIYAPVRLANWEEQVVLPHEYTLPGPKVDRLNLLATAHAQFSPLLAMYDDPGSVLDLLAEIANTPPTIQFGLERGAVAAAATAHRLWHIAEPRLVARLVDSFKPLQIYIADGHHRYETALVYRDRMRATGAGPNAASEYVLMALVETSDPGMLILPTHRLLRGLGQIDSGRTLCLLSERFDVERLPLADEGFAASTAEPASARTPFPANAEGSRPSFTILGLEPGYCHRLTLRASVDLGRELANIPEVLQALDTVVLQHLIFEPVFGLSNHDVESGERIQYTRDPGEAMRAFVAGQAQLVFFLNATRMDQIRIAAKAGQRMPQKTTYFYPKPVTGMVFFDHERSLP
jgi:uncharacterized protein (DUF1015 family)